MIVSRQPIFTNLKSNTMKTLQKYDFIFNGQIFIEKKCAFKVLFCEYFGFSVLKCGLFHVKHQSFQVFSLRMIDIDGVVCRLV